MESESLFSCYIAEIGSSLGIHKLIPKHLIQMFHCSMEECAVIFFTFLGLVPVPVQLGKIVAFFLKLGKIINHNSEEKNGIERLF